MQYENEYWTKVRQAFYKQVRDTNWGNDEEQISKPRGRKPKQIIRYESAPRSEGERRVMQSNKSKFFNFN